MLTAIYTRGRTHFTDAGYVFPVCGSRAQIVGFEHRADENVTIQGVPCPKCMERLGLVAEPAGEPA